MKEPFPGPGQRDAGETGRRALREWRPTDAPVLVEAWHDPDIAAHCGVPSDPTVERAERWIAGWEARRVSGAALDLVAVDDADQVIGEVGLHPVGDGLEIGWWVLPGRRRQGVATAMVTAFVGWVAEALPGRDLVARIPPGHAPSERVAAAAGLARRGRDGDCTRWERRHGLE